MQTQSDVHFDGKPLRASSDIYDSPAFHEKERTLCTHTVFLNAAKAFAALHQDDDDEPSQRKQSSNNNQVNDLDIEFANDQERRLTLELSYSTLKYQRLLKDLLDQCTFFIQFPELVEEEALVMVILYYFMNTKFEQRNPAPEETLDPLATKVEDVIMSIKTKLSAWLARLRIKANALSVELLLPEVVRSKDKISSQMKLYMWINQLKTSICDVIEKFKDEGFTLDGGADMTEGKKFSLDLHCDDVIVFPPDYREYLLQHHLYKAGHIVIQDKSSCIAPHSVKCLVGDDDDIVHVNIGSGLITAHIASLLKNTQCRIWGFGASNGNMSQNVKKHLASLGTKNLKLISESFLHVDPEDHRFKGVRVVLVTANCSKSALNNPVDFVVNEGEDMTVLWNLSQGEISRDKLDKIFNEELEVLKHALLFSKVQAVIYMTRSIHELENETVVGKAMEYVNLIHSKKNPYRLVPPVLPFTADEIENGIGVCGKFIKFNSTESMNGCFLAIIARETEEKNTVKDVLSRAESKGLFGAKSKKTEVKTASSHMKSVSEPKVLYKRIKRATHKRSRQSSCFTSDTRTFPKLSNTKSRSIKSAITVGERLHTSRIRSKEYTEPPQTRKASVRSEHQRIVNHPKPFR